MSQGLHTAALFFVSLFAIASARISADINECDSRNGGCEHGCVNTQGSHRCTCRTGYKLLNDKRSCQDVNECDSHNGGCEQECVNTAGNYRCACETGYKLQNDRRSCEDINECLSDNGGCKHVCVNTRGSHHCICRTGYKLYHDRRSCQDLNECKEYHKWCDHDCTNTVASYICKCRKGYVLGSNKRKCKDINECQNDPCNSNKNFKCVNTVGSFKCVCQTGFTFDSNGFSCQDVDECLNNERSGCSHGCRNTKGSYECTCPKGYKLQKNLKVCEDVNECQNNPNACSSNNNFKCVNTLGSFKCVCQTGFKLDSNGTFCHDVDECLNKTKSGCSHGCQNIKGSYKCTCPKGFKLQMNLKICEDIDECSMRKCNQQCKNYPGGYQCLCQNGYKLYGLQYCYDINECYSNNGGCKQDCVNTPGSHHCTCRTGYKLQHDGFSCQDVNECLVNKGGCQGNCSNTLGSFKCSCPVGYHLRHTYYCHDVDECKTKNGGCSHHCHNNQGSYTCSCSKGYELTEDGHGCADINECLNKNGGCQQNCHNYGGGYLCYCKTGFLRVGKDRKDCREVNECMEYHGLCDHNCTNTVGSYICRCRKGYVLGSNKHNCEDINECSFNNGNCSQHCENFPPGGFRCFCRDGFNLQRDNRTCTDVDECQVNNGGCSHYCKNADGGFQCSCKKGFYLDVNGKICKARFCGVLPNLMRGRFSCTEGVSGKGTFEAKCNYTCNPGFHLKGSSERICDSDGSWTGTHPVCERKKCKVLKRPEHSFVLPKSCLIEEREFESGCFFVCSQGYKLTGPIYLQCLSTGKWSHSQLKQKCEDIQPPSFGQTCPKDMYRKTDIGKSYASVSWTPPNATDNSGIFTVITIPQHLKMPHYFKIGRTEVIYVARDMKKQEAKCSFSVEVQDVEKPKLSCPLQTTIIGEGPSVNATWPLPNITDNSGEVMVVDSNPKLGTQLTYGKYSVTYTATDKSGNTGVCSFSLLVQKKRCKPYPAPTNGRANCDTWLYGGFCSVSCNTGFGFAIPPSERYICGIDGQWYPKKAPPTCSGIVDTNLAVITVQFRGPNMPCDTFPGVLKFILMTSIPAVVSKCSLYHLACTYTAADHCDPLNVQNLNLTITVTKTLGSGKLHDHINKLIDVLQNKKRILESQYYTEITMESAVKAICGQPGVVSIGQYCVRCPVGTRQKGSKCEKCPQGTAQAKEGQTECVKITGGGMRNKQGINGQRVFKQTT